MKYVKRISFIFLAFIIVAIPVAVNCNAEVVANDETYATACMPVFQIFGQSHNVEYVFDAETTQENIQMLIDLWNQYTAYDPTAPALGSMYNQIVSEGTYEIASYNSMQYVAFNISALLNQKLCAFFDWVLSGPAEMSKVDNQYYEWSLNQNNTVDPIAVVSNNYATINGHTVSVVPCTYSYTNQYSTFTYDVSTPSGSAFAFSYLNTTNNSGYICLINPDSSFTTRIITTRLSDNVVFPETNGSSSVTGEYNFYYVTPKNISGYMYTGTGDPNPVLLFGSVGGNAVIETGTDSISVQPYNQTTEIDIPDPLNVDSGIYIVSDQLAPDLGIETDTGITTAEDVDTIADDIIQGVVDGESGILDTTPTTDPTEVFIPFLPITLPSFNFSLSGIWHYVVAWVGTLGAWFSLVFTTWSYLPYAISVPVYATAVIVIVLGVYKRFFM